MIFTMEVLCYYIDISPDFVKRRFQLIRRPEGTNPAFPVSFLVA
jgi:hypothetical protein